MCECVRAYDVGVDVCMWLCMWLYVDMYVYVHICVCVLCLCMWMCMWMYMYMCVLSTCVCMAQKYFVLFDYILWEHTHKYYLYLCTYVHTSLLCVCIWTCLNYFLWQPTHFSEFLCEDWATPTRLKGEIWDAGTSNHKDPISIGSFTVNLKKIKQFGLGHGLDEWADVEYAEGIHGQGASVHFVAFFENRKVIATQM